MKSSEAKVRLWKVHLERSDRPSLTLECADECVKIIEVFSNIVKDVKSKQMELSIFATLFSVEPADASNHLQKEIIQLQSPKVGANPPLFFYKCGEAVMNFPLWGDKHWNTHLCVEQLCCWEQFSSNIIRDSAVPQTHSLGKLWVTTSSVPAKIAYLTKEKQFQPSY